MSRFFSILQELFGIDKNFIGSIEIHIFKGGVGKVIKHENIDIK